MTEGYIGPLKYLEQDEVVAAFSGEEFDHEVLHGFTLALHDEIRGLMETAGIPIINSSCRTKLPDRIVEKVEKALKDQGRDWPVADIYGIRLILDERARGAAAELIMTHYPAPKIFPWGLESFRTGGNIYSLHDFYSVRLNVIFDKNRIAEISLMTPDEFAVEEKTRDEYEARRRS